jgi:hypothetical protein
MSDSYQLADRLAAQQIAERVQLRQRSGRVAPRRTGRHALARSLHRIANALDG